MRGAPPPSSALSGRIAFKTGTSYGFRDALAIGYDKGDDDRRLGRAARQRPDARPDRPPGRRADPVRRLRAARPRHRADPPAQGRAARRDERRAAAAAAPFAQRRAQDDRRDRRDAAENRLSARRRAHRSRAEGRRRASETLALKALGGALPLTWFVNGAPIGEPDLRRQSRLAPRRRRLRARVGDRRQRRVGFDRGAAGVTAFRLERGPRREAKGGRPRDRSAPDQAAFRRFFSATILRASSSGTAGLK